MKKNVSLIQAKQLARRFDGYEDGGGRIQLRLIPKELHTYKDDRNGIAFGALFAIAHNTNPEVYLMLEIRDRNGKRSWEYALAEFTFATVHVTLDGKEVWDFPGVTSGTRPSDPYYLFFQPKRTLAGRPSPS